MGYLAGGPAVSASRYPVDGVATSGQSSISVPGGFAPGFVDVFVGGARLSPGDYDDSSGSAVKLTKPMAAGTQYAVTAWNPTMIVRPTNVPRVTVEGDATSGQTVIPIPGGFVAGLADVYVGGTLLQKSDYNDSDGQTIVLAKALSTGTSYKVFALNPGITAQPVGGQLAGFRNRVINGNFDLWQRGTSLAAAAGFIYLADRWQNASAGSTIAPSQQAFVLGQTAVPGEPAFFHRCVVASVAGAANMARFQQNIEGVRTLAGQQATLSFWAKADAAKNIAVEFAQAFGGGGSPSAIVQGIGVATLALTAAWQQFKVSVAIPSITGKTLGTDGTDLLAARIWFDAGSSFNALTNNLGQQSGIFDIARVQLEPGNVATQFEQRPIGTELALCQRYYTSSYDLGVAPGTPNATTPYSVFFSVAASWEGPKITFPSPMRTGPTVTAYSPVTGATGMYRDTNNNVDRAAVVSVANQRGVTLAANANGQAGTGGSFAFAATAEL